MGETFQYSSLWKGRRKERSQKKKLQLKFLYVQLDPVHVAPKMEKKRETEIISLKFNGFHLSLTARKLFCSKANFPFFSELKLKCPTMQTFNKEIQFINEYAQQKSKV